MLDLDCLPHGIDNLYVTDVGFFPSIGAVNPTLSIIAYTVWVADGIAARLLGPLNPSACLIMEADRVSVNRNGRGHDV